MTGEAVVALATLVGYAAFHLDIHRGPVPAAWRVVAPLLAVGHLALGWWDLRTCPPDSKLSETENIWLRTISVCIWMFSVAPALWFNLRLAYG